MRRWASRSVRPGRASKAAAMSTGGLGALGPLEEGDRPPDLGGVDGDQLPAVVTPVVEDLLGVVGQQRDGRVLPGGHGTSPRSAWLAGRLPVSRRGGPGAGGARTR